MSPLNLRDTLGTVPPDKPSGRGRHKSSLDHIAALVAAVGINLGLVAGFVESKNAAIEARQEEQKKAQEDLLETAAPNGTIEKGHETEFVFKADKIKLLEKRTDGEVEKLFQTAVERYAAIKKILKKMHERKSPNLAIYNTILEYFGEDDETQASLIILLTEGRGNCQARALLAALLVIDVLGDEAKPFIESVTHKNIKIEQTSSPQVRGVAPSKSQEKPEFVPHVRTVVRDHEGKYQLELPVVTKIEDWTQRNLMNVDELARIYTASPATPDSLPPLKDLHVKDSIFNFAVSGRVEEQKVSAMRVHDPENARRKERILALGSSEVLHVELVTLEESVEGNVNGNAYASIATAEDITGLSTEHLEMMKKHAREPEAGASPFSIGLVGRLETKIETIVGPFGDARAYPDNYFPVSRHKPEALASTMVLLNVSPTFDPHTFEKLPASLEWRVVTPYMNRDGFEAIVKGDTSVTHDVYVLAEKWDPAAFDELKNFHGETIKLLGKLNLTPADATRIVAALRSAVNSRSGDRVTDLAIELSNGTLTPQVAHELAQIGSVVLSLGVMTGSTPPKADALTQFKDFKGETLRLDIRDIDIETASVLVTLPIQTIRLPNVAFASLPKQIQYILASRGSDIFEDRQIIFSDGLLNGQLYYEGTQQ